MNKLTPESILKEISQSRRISIKVHSNIYQDEKYRCYAISYVSDLIALTNGQVEYRVCNEIFCESIFLKLFNMLNVLGRWQ